MTLRVELEPPLDLPGSLEPFRRWGDDLLDRFDGLRLLRTAPSPGARAGAGDGSRDVVAFAARPIGDLTRPALEVSVGEQERPDPSGPDRLGTAEAAVRAMFVLAPALPELATHDPIVAALDRRFPGVRPVLQLDLLPSLVRSISAQQINLRWATVIRSRIAQAYGEAHPVDGDVVYSLSAERLAEADAAELRALQLTGRKAVSVIACAQAVAGGELSMAGLSSLEDEAVIERLIVLPGIGRWSAEWFLARTLGRPRVVAGDLGVRKAVGLAYGGGAMPSEEEVRQLTAHWGEAAGVAQQLLLHALSEGELQEVLAAARSME